MRCVIYLSLYLTICVVNASMDMRLSKAAGYNRLTSSSGVISTFSVTKQLKCAQRCLIDETCNGYNYHTSTGTCEIIPYSLSDRELLTDLAADGWHLWLPEGCPDVGGLARQSFSSLTISVVIQGYPVLDDIYCRVSGNSATSYLNLREDNRAVSDHSAVRGSVYTKYRLSIPELQVDRHDVTFASFIPGYSSHNGAASAGNCRCTTNVQVGSYAFNINGTSFELTDDVTNIISGWQPGTAADELSAQYAYVEVWGCCGSAILNNPEGSLTLQIATG